MITLGWLTKKEGLVKIEKVGENEDEQKQACVTVMIKRIFAIIGHYLENSELFAVV